VPGRRRREERKAKHRRIAEDLARLREFIHAWDPGGLIAMGVPENEFDTQRAQLYGALTSGAVQSEAELGKRVAAIFQGAFDSSLTPENCADVAQSIWSWWQERTSDQS
jgi:hypothetical protein